MGWWIALGIITLLAVLPLGVSVLYDEDGAVVKVIAGPVKITLFPRPKKDKKPKKEKKKDTADAASRETPAAKPTAKPKKKKKKQATAQKKPEPEHNVAPKQEPVRPVEAPKPAAPPQPAEPEKAEEKPKKGGGITDFLPLVRIALDFLGDFKRKLRVNYLVLKLTLAGDDPCDLAVNYGRAWTALGNLLPRLERFLVIKKRDVDVQCDFTASQTTVIARLDLTITLGRLLAAVIVFAVRALIAFLKIMKKRKGGALNEQKSS